MIRGLTKLHRALAAFALLALFVRAALPAGYMFGGQDASGRQAIVTLCSANGPIQIAIDLETGAVQDAPSEHEDEPMHKAPCVFAGAALLTEPDLAALPAGERVELAAPSFSLADLRPGLGLAAPPPPAIGPPLFI